MIFKSNRFKEIWAVDFEFHSDGLEGNRPSPVCLVAKEFMTGRTVRLWHDQFEAVPPYRVDNDALFVAYYVSAEISCHLVLSWPIPVNIIDLYPEFRNLTNGLPLPHGKGLIGALSYFHLPNIGALKKEITRDLILTGGPWDHNQKAEILEYCESDVDALLLLSAEIFPNINIDQALIRGRYASAVAIMKHNGVPIDVEYFEMLKTNWKEIKVEFIRKLTADYGIYDGTSFRVENFKKWLIKNRITWPTLESGALNLQDATFKDMARSYPEVSPIREARIILSSMRLSNLTVGSDNRNRCLLSPFGTRTGRNAPSTNKFIFGPAVWLRGLIKPEKGQSLAYIDWSAQEFGIAAKLSEDRRMLEAYESGDPYLNLGKQMGYIPEDGTIITHAKQRDRFKNVVLATNYGMGPRALATLINQPLIVAKKLLKKHREVYKTFWKWSDGTVDFAILFRYLKTTFGWCLHLPPTEYNSRTLRNFLIQANGAEMLRIAVILAVDAGVKVCAPIHDAILIEADLSRLQEHIILTQNAMLKASQVVLSGFNLRTDVKVVEYPNRYIDKRGIETWDTISTLLESM